ncbi:MAG: hypothetical protein JW994_01410, partial [Candidatus Omnitrophica bacterium]|nr:hypothetical protein [Candidatus Omnitrophota bacterium]
ERIGGAIMGGLRSFVIIGILFVGLLLMPVKYIEKSVMNSNLCGTFVKADLKLYGMIIDAVISKNKMPYKLTLSKLLSEKDYYMFKTPDLKKRSRFFNE